MKKLCWLFILFLLTYILRAQEMVTISGYVKDSVSGESLLGAVVNDESFGASAQTNNFGFFSLEINKKDPIELICSFTGFEKKITGISAVNDTMITILLTPSVNLLKAVVIDAHKNAVLNDPVMSINHISITEIKLLPSVLGETDILKTFQLTPGVQPGQEGTSALYVRGGTPDQNLILLDDIPLYYIDHAGGFFSIFDVNAIKSVELIKGGFPARYGERLSSVLDVRMNDGNKNKLAGTAEIGVISTKLSLNGPIKEKTTFQISARKSLIDLFSKLITSMNSGGQISAGYGIYDLNGKLAHEINDRNKIFISAYTGRDVLSVNLKNSGYSTYSPNYYAIDSKSSLQWGSDLLVIRWNHVYGSKTFSNISAAYTNFIYATKFDMEYTDPNTNSNVGNYTYTLSSHIKDFICKADIEHTISNDYSIRTGFNATIHSFTPSTIAYSQTGELFQYLDTLITGKNYHPFEAAIYLENEYQLNTFISFNAGLRNTWYFVSDTLFPSLQPRFTMNIRAGENNAFKISFASMKQNLHLLKSSGTGIPVDLWLPATDKVAPEKAIQAAAAYVHFFKNLFELNTEIYFKKYNGLIDYREGASFFGGSANWENKVYTGGKGISYGFELMIKKTAGKHTGWISYSVSKSTRAFTQIDSAISFPSSYDRRHNFSVVYNLRINRKINLSSVYVFSTGYPITLGTDKYDLYTFSPGGQYGDNFSPQYGFQDAYIYDSRNNYTMPAYHRLDIACSFAKYFRNGNNRTFKTGVYNVYNHLNAYYLFFDYDKNKNLGLYKISLFPVMPFFSYTLNF